MVYMHPQWLTILHCPHDSGTVYIIGAGQGRIGSSGVGYGQAASLSGISLSSGLRKKEGTWSTNRNVS